LHLLNLAAKASGASSGRIRPPNSHPAPPNLRRPHFYLRRPYRECNETAQVAAVPVHPLLLSNLRQSNIGASTGASGASRDESPQDNLANPPVEAKPPAKGTGGGRGKDRTAAALEAEGRRLLEEAKTAPPGVQILETGEYVVDPAPGSRVDLRNRGNRLLEQARKMRLAEDEKRESPPVDTPQGPDILADIPTAPPAESQGTAATCADKRPDIPGIKIVPPVCQPSGFYPFRYVTKCDKPTPIMPESGYGDPVGCSHCGARWGGAA
jgi:hypothetical protein